jgi:hypothetical protein|tara:strand:- start:266 stop:613 length:348 start_codon:yes stop_codon:yes gene_type:complete
MDTIFNLIDDFLKEVEGYTGISEYVGDRKFSDVMHNPSPELVHLVAAIELLKEIKQSPPAFTPYLKHDGITKMHGEGPSADITEMILQRMHGVELMPHTRIKRVDGRVFLVGEDS